MFASIVSLLKGDLDRQVSWAKKEFSRQAGTAALKAGLACRFVGSAASPQPSVHSFRYDNVKEAAKKDLSAQSSAIMSSLRQSSIGGAISTTEDVLAKGERITHMASEQMRDGSRGSLIAILGVTALTGIIIGKKIRPGLGKFEISGSTLSSLISVFDHLILRRTADHHEN
jgi:hypothetical protein